VLQHVHEPTRPDNLLDLIVTDQELTVGELSVDDDVSLVSDHRLVTAAERVRHGLRRPVQIQSTSIRVYADGFANQLQNVVVLTFKRVAPVRIRTC